MRVVGGWAGGRRLSAPPGQGTRPTSDRVREAVFNTVGSIGALAPGARVLDLFAGSGALGVEALSRGAARATFLERERRACETIARNLEVVRGAPHHPEGTVVPADALAWLERQPAGIGYDVAFADPPYAFTAWERLLNGLARLGAQLAVLESGAELVLAGGWEIVRVKHYGGTVVTLIQPSVQPPSGALGRVPSKGPQ